MKQKLTASLGLLILLCLFTLFRFPVSQVRSLNPQSLSDTISNSQLSYFAKIGVGNSIGNSMLKIDPTAGPSFTTNNLFAGDTLAIGIGGSMHTYTVLDVGSTILFSINTGISAVDLSTNAVAFATRSATHVIGFTPMDSITNGKWQVLIRSAALAAENYKDGIPDMDGFDMPTNFANTDVTCPWGGSVAAVGTTVAVTTGNPAVTNYYHVFTCDNFSGGTTPTGVGGTITIGTTHKLINPTPNHSAANEGLADVYQFLLRHLDSTSTVIDADTDMGRMAVVESVKVTAQVDPSLTFQISNPGGATRCGVPLNATQQSVVTATAVPFGSIAIGSTLNTLAQQLNIITNANGYVVTTNYLQTMRNIGDTGVATTIPDTDCDAAACAGNGTQGSWTSPDGAKSEFGYSLESAGGTPTLAFTAGANFTSRHFTTTPSTIFSNNGIMSANHIVNVCYRVTATTFQKTGDYESQVVYTATPTF